MILNRIPTVFVPVANLRESVEWYSKILGVDIDHVQWEQIESLPVYTFSLEGSSLTLDANIVKGKAIQPSPYPICNIACENIHEVWNHFEREGVELPDKIIYFPDLAYFNFKDINGNTLMMCSE
jgi:predicted enzyme related to lactoylglutathione lyase